MSSIAISKKHGLNPHLTVCQRCGKDGEEIILTGAAHIYKCDSCGMNYIGRPKNGRCQNKNCHANTSGVHTLVDQGEPDPSMKFPTFCKDCKEEVKKFKNIIAKGGIPIRCSDCKMEGVIRGDHPIAKKVRAQHGLAGLEFTKADCPKCGSNSIKEESDEEKKD